jgi:hypothetical protein
VQILEGLIDKLRDVSSRVFDKRTSTKNAVFPMEVFSMSAFAMFFMQSCSFLSWQRRMEIGKGTSNCRSLFGIDRIPADNHIRGMLDYVDPYEYQPIFDEAIHVAKQHGVLKDYEVLDGKTLVLLDGTEYFSSKKISCSQCLIRNHKNAPADHYHTMLSATIAKPGRSSVIPMCPEFIDRQDGATKQDCELNAAKRWLERHGRSVADLNPVYVGDALFANQPLAKIITSLGADYILTCKAKADSAIGQTVQLRSKEELVEKVRKTKTRIDTYTYRWINSIPMRQDNPINTNWVELTIMDKAGVVKYRNEFLTSMGITSNNVAQLVKAGRCRWKIENEGFNVLKNNGYELEHNFGHGKINLSKVLVVLNLLAFTFHEICDRAETQWQKARSANTRERFFTDISAYCNVTLFDSWTKLIEFCVSLLPKPIRTLKGPYCGP